MPVENRGDAHFKPPKLLAIVAAVSEVPFKLQTRPCPVEPSKFWWEIHDGPKLLRRSPHPYAYRYDALAAGSGVLLDLMGERWNKRDAALRKG